MSDHILETEQLSKYFGALAAADDVSITFAPGRIHAIIGPNGAGKTTLINLLSGELQPTSGRIRYKGRDITGASPDKISRMGIGRSFQRTNVFSAFTCRQNCWLAAQSRLRTSMLFLRPARRFDDVGRRADRALDLCGLTDRAETVAGVLSHGEQRQLEIGMILATEPELLLLDEPLAGMGREEADQVVALLGELAADHTLVLIEHDMDAVFRVAQRLTVMVNGRVLETGTPDEVRRNPEVQAAYLGAEADVS